MKFAHARYLPVLIIGLGLFLRVWLGLINREANDMHADVVELIVKNNALPEKTACWSCYQPKLYYIICAGIAKLFNVTGFYSYAVVMQLVNVFIGFFILLLFWKFIQQQNLKESSKYLLLAFFCLNPCLVGINVQSTNDTPVIFCGILATFACFRLFQSGSVKWGVVLVAALIAGALTKASIIVLAGALVIVLLLKLLAEPMVVAKIKTAKYLCVGAIVFLLIVPFAGGYWNNYKTYGSLTISTWGKDTPPHFFKKTPVFRPGLESMATGFFTFRLIDLVQHPFISNEIRTYAVHRTSLWSHIYARTVFLHFDQWPLTWQSRKPFILNVGRMLLLLGVVPLLIFLAGILSNSIIFLKNLFSWNKAYLAEPQNYFYFAVTLAYLASSVFYTYTYRDFSSMKSIYIFPGLLAFIKIFIDGYALVKPGNMLRVVNVVLIVMIVLSLADIIFLMHQLRHNDAWIFQ